MPLFCESLFCPFSVSGMDSYRWSGHCFSLVAWFLDRQHVTKWHTAFLLFYVRECMCVRLCVCKCTLWAHVCWYVMWFKTNGKKLKVPEPNFKHRQTLFKKTWMFSGTFGVCFFHLNTVSKNLGKELKTTNAGNFIRCFKIKAFWFIVIQLVMDCPVAPRVTNVSVSQQRTWFPFCYSLIKYWV